MSHPRHIEARAAFSACWARSSGSRGGRGRNDGVGPRGCDHEKRYIEHLTLGRVPLLAFLSAAALADPSHAQVITVGAGALFSKHRPEPVAEVYVTSPPINNIRAYLTTAWTDNEWEPTFISALDRALPGAA